MGLVTPATSTLEGDGTVVAWGNNFDGQTNVPSGLTNVVDLAAGGFHSLAVKRDSTAPPDSTAPTVSSINRASSNPTNTTDNVDWTVTFSENSTGVDTADFALANNALGGSPAISSVTQGGNASVYTVTATTGSGSGTLGLDLSDNDSIKDTANNPLGGTSLLIGDFDGELYTIDRSAPNVTATPSRNADHNGWYNAPFTVSFSASDTGGSGNVSCDPNVNYNGPDTNGASISGSCTDEAGNSDSATFAFKYDATAPQVVSTSPATIAPAPT